MAVGDCFRVACLGDLNDQLIVNVFHYRQATANTSTLSNLESLARAVNAGPLAAIAVASAENMSWFKIESRTFTVPTTPLSGFDLDISVNGGQEDVPAPPTVAWVVRKKTALLGRKYRGRNYFAGIGLTSIEEGKIAAASLTNFTAAKDAIAASITWTAAGSPSFVPCIAALFRPAPGDPVELRQNDVISTFLDRTLRSQRRREIGVGA